MFTSFPDYLTPANFAKVYNGKGTSRKYIYDLIKKERAKPGSTTIDVLEVDGRPFVKHRIQFGKDKQN